MNQNSQPYDVASSLCYQCSVEKYDAPTAEGRYCAYGFNYSIVHTHAYITLNACVAMEHQHGAESAAVVDAASSCPNTPLSRTRTEHRRTVFHPFPSGQAVSPPSTPCVSSASFVSREVQQSHNLHAPSADTTQPQRDFQCLLGSPPDEYEFLPAALPPRDNSSTSTPRRRCRSFIELLLATACLSCQSASRQVLEQHVRRRKFKRSCEALTNFLQLRVGAETAPAFPGSQQLPVLVAAAALCTPKQQRRLLRSACTQGSCGPPAVSDGVYNDHATSLPYSGASTYSRQTLQASSTAASYASCAYRDGSSVSLTGRADAGADVFACTGRSFAVGADRRQEATGRLPGRALPASGKAEKACRSSLAAAAVMTQHTYPVQHIRVSRNGDGAAEIALQINLPEQCNKGVEGSAAVLTAEPGVLASAAAGTHALPDSRSEEGCSESPAVDGGRNKTSEDTGGARVDQAPAASPDRRKVSRNKGEHKDIPGVEGDDGAKEEGSTSALIGAKNLRNGSTVSFPSVTAGGPSPPPRGETLSLEARTVAAAASTMGRSATTQEDSAARETQGFAPGEGDQEGRILAKDGCSDTTPTTAAPPVARLTIQQLKDVVGAAQLYCDTLGAQLQCFAENMPRLQRLSQLETFLQVNDRSLRPQACTSGDSMDPGGVDDKDSCRADRGRNGTTRSTGADRNSSSGIDVGSGGNGAERPDDVGVLTTADGDGPPLVDSSGTTRASPSGVPQQQVTFMSVLQQLRLPRDKDLTAAQVLGVHAAVDAAAAAPGETCQRSARLQVTAASSGGEAAVPEPAGSAATTVVKKRKTGEPVDNKAGEKQQSSSDAAGGKEPKEAPRVSASGAPEAPEADGDTRYSRRQGRGSKQQQQPCRIVSLAEVHDLSVLERSRESATAASRWHQHALRKKAVWRHKVEEAMNSAVAATGISAVERTAKEIRRGSTESSVILLGHSEGSGDVETWTEAKMKRVVCPSKKSGGTGNAAEEGIQHGKSLAAESSDEEEEIVTGAREIEALCEAVGQESVKLLELVTFYENFSAECLRYATKDCGFSEDESRRNGEHV